MKRRTSTSTATSAWVSPAHDSDTHGRSVELLCHSRARVWRARGIPNSAGGRGEGPGFLARQPRAGMTEQEIDKTGTVTMMCRTQIATPRGWNSHGHYLPHNAGPTQALNLADLGDGVPGPHGAGNVRLPQPQR